MRLVVTSDTHGKHDWLKLPDGDVLIHCGDWSTYGQRQEQIDFVNWLAKQKPKYREIIVVPGNHDIFAFEHYKETRDMFNNAGAIFLEEASCTIGGIKFYGSPWTPFFGGWPYMLSRGQAMKFIWDRIPDNTDILITHGPPYGFLDEVKDWSGKMIHVGCEELLKAIERVKPKVHVFGHIHEGAKLGPNLDGCDSYGKIKLFCASMMDKKYGPTYQPKIIDVEI